jgi:ribosomal protein S18 acetylase RimI-like enzyme
MDKKEILFKRVTDTEVDDYMFTEKLLVESFPPDEYRCLEEQRAFVKERENFHMNIIYRSTTPVGIISYWNFDTFTYVEHFAILPALRNCGYGAAAIKRLIEKVRSIVLEVEKPDDETSRRRIAFYQRCGLTLCEKEYIQPAYRADSNEIPMHLMSCSVEIDKNFEHIKSSIYREVYGK